MRRRTFALAVCFIGLLVLFMAARSGYGSAMAQTKEQRRTGNIKFTIRLEPAGTSYVAGEDILLELRLENRGSAPVSLPDPEKNANSQPAYTVTGPAFPDGITVNLRAHGRDTASSPPDPSRAALFTLDPGESWQGHVRINNLVPITKPGTYRVSASLAWEGIETHSNSLTFTVEPLRAVQASVGMGWGFVAAPEIFGLWLHRGKDARVLFQAGYDELRPDLGEVQRQGITRLADLPATARDPLLPWANYSRFDDLFFWALWREGPVVKGRSSLGATVQLDLGTEPSAVVRPALMVRSHDADVFFFRRRAEGGAELVWTRFSDPVRHTPGPARVVWTGALPGRIAAVTVALEPPGRADRRHLALLAEEGGRLRILHAVVDEKGPPRRFDVCDFGQEYVPAGDSMPALAVDGRGNARVAVVVCRRGNDRSCAFVEAVFEAGGKTGKFQVLRGIELPEPAVAARAGYWEKKDGQWRRDWVVLTQRGSIYTAVDGEIRRVRQGWATDAPLELLVLSQASYLLEFTPMEGGVLRPLRLP